MRVATVLGKVTTTPAQLSAALQHKGPHQPLHGHQQSQRIQLQLFQQNRIEYKLKVLLTRFYIAKIGQEDSLMI